MVIKRRNSEKEILFDFDGTLSYYERYKPGVYGPPNKEVFKWAKRFIEAGYDVKIFTARLDQDTHEAERREANGIMNWCIEHGLVLDDGSAPPITRQKSRRTHLIVDDRAFGIIKNSHKPKENFESEFLNVTFRDHDE